MNVRIISEMSHALVIHTSIPHQTFIVVPT